MNCASVCFFARVKDLSVLHRVEFYAQDIRILSELGFDVRLATSLNEIKPADLYFVWWWTWAFAPAAYAKLMGRPVLITGTFDYWSFHQRTAYQRALMQYALRAADANVFVSRLEYEQVSRGLRVRNPSYSPHIVDTSVYCPSYDRHSDVVFTIAWMNAANAERKCIPEIIRAAALVHQTHPNIRFVIAGDSAPYQAQLERLITEVKGSEYIHLLGILSLEDKIRYMQTCQVYLQPSRYEGFGLAILEAMSCGAAVVTSPTGAVPEVVGDAAMLVDGTSPHVIAQAVRDLLDNRVLRESLGRRARARSESEFPLARRKQDLKAIIEDVLA